MHKMLVELSVTANTAGGAAAAAPVQLPAADDPSANPVLLPPRTRADVVQDRPAGGSAEEVAAANPALAAAVPATVGKADVDGAGADALLDAADAAANHAGGSVNTDAAGAAGRDTRSREGGQRDSAAGADVGGGVGGVGGVGEMSDGSGMEIPELAVQEGWTR
jgi:hypothetical protein